MALARPQKTAVPGRPESAGPASVVAAGTLFEGILDTTGDLLIMGRVKGTIRASGRVEVADSGQVAATVEAGELAVHGTVLGPVRVAGAITVGPTGRIKGDVAAASARVMPGGLLEGVYTALEARGREG